MPAGTHSLLTDAGWECLSATTADGRVVIEGPANVVNDYRVRLQVSGDFIIRATLEGDGGSAGLVFWNSLPTMNLPQATTPWWTTAAKVRVAVNAGLVNFSVFDGSGSNPAYRFTTKGPPLTGAVSVSLEKAGGELALTVNGSEVTRTTVLGPVVDGPIYFGASVAANSRLTIHDLAATAGHAGEVRVEESPLLASTSLPRQPLSLRDMLSASGKLVGVSGITPQQFRWSPEYRAVAAREFGMIGASAGTSFAWKGIHPERERYSFCDADQIVAFARANGMLVDAKNLTYGGVDPEWIEKGQFSRAELMDLLHRHIETVVGRYRGQIAVWHVSAEVFEYGPGNAGRLRETVWTRGIGPDYLDMAFHWAREADPNAILILEDTDTEGLGTKSDAFFDLVKGLRARGVPIDGVGMEMHWRAVGSSTGKPPLAPQDIAANMKRLAELGLDVYITEMDVGIAEPVTPEKLALQAQIYRDVLATCVAASNCRALLVFGVDDGHTWLMERPRFSGLASPVLFDESFRPKPAYQALIGLLKQR